MLHLPAPGMSHRDRAVLAMTMAYRYKSDAKAAMLDTAMRLSDNKGRTFARRLGACLRLAYNLSGGAPGLLHAGPAASQRARALAGRAA